jgi:UDP-N-acetylmuramoylalanine--D-glutamate ligase
VGIDGEAIRRGLMGYAPLPHRLETVATIRGVRWVNDSKATNPNAAAAGIRAIAGPLILLAGGSSKEADFAEIAGLMRTRTRHTILFGQTRHQLAEAIGDGHPVTLVETLNDAVSLADGMSTSGDTVLLGPACASYDQFRSYVHRGEVFCELVSALG